MLMDHVSLRAFVDVIQIIGSSSTVPPPAVSLVTQSLRPEWNTKGILFVNICVIDFVIPSYVRG